MILDRVASIYGPSNSPNTSATDPAGTGSTTVSGQIVGPPNAMNTPASSLQTTILPGIEGTIFASPVTMWFVILLALVGSYYLIHKHVSGVEKELATPRVGFSSMIVVGLEASLFIWLMKAVLNLYRIPGLTEFFAGV